jgi:hypothetical protein
MEISKSNALQLVRHWAEGYYAFAQACHNYHVSGFADVEGNLFSTPNAEGQRLTEEFETYISDEELHKAFRLLRKYVQEIIEVDREIVNWLASCVGLPAPQDKRDRRRLRHRLREIVEGSDQGPVGPIWATSPEYQALVSKSAQILQAASVVWQGIDQRIQLIE